MSKQGPSVEDVRRQLEGRLEVLEAASGHHARLHRVLAWWGWERRLRREPGLVRSVLASEAGYAEALERVLRRVDSEGWPESAPGLALIRDVRARRAELEALVHERLAAQVWTPGAPSLVEDLERLELLALGFVSLEPRPTHEPGVGMAVGQGLIYLGEAVGLVSGAVGLLVTVGAGLSLMLASGLGLERHLRRRLGAGQTVEVNPVEVTRAEHLTGALELRRRLPGLITRADQARLSPVICFTATFREPSGAEQTGHAVLRPGFLAFLPEATGPGILRALAGPESPAVPGRVEVPWIVEQLLYLPSGGDFDTTLARAAKAVGGAHWSLGTDSRLALRGMELHFSEGGSELRGQVTGPALKVAAKLVFVRRW
jgi:hypothetical protein